MKNFIFGVITTILILIIFGFVYEINEPNDVPDKEWLIAPRFLTLQEGVSKEEAREWLVNEYLLVYREFPGFNAMVGEPVSSAGWGKTNDNDKEKDFVMIYFLDSKETANHYFPDGKNSDEINEGIKKHQSTFDKLFGKYFVLDKYQHEDYLMFASSK
jgi:hypothetical protein